MLAAENPVTRFRLSLLAGKAAGELAATVDEQLDDRELTGVVTPIAPSLTDAPKVSASTIEPICRVNSPGQGQVNTTEMYSYLVRLTNESR